MRWLKCPVNNIHSKRTPKSYEAEPSKLNNFNTMLKKKYTVIKNKTFDILSDSEIPLGRM